MDDFREWLSDNLRYILLGLAVILVIVLAVFAVRFISGFGKDDKAKESESQQQAVVTEADSQSESDKSETLKENEPALLELVQNYYHAIENKDLDALRQMVESLNEKDQQVIENDNLIESYHNISVYSKNGPVQDSYVAYVYYEGKLAGYETKVPSLTALYLQKREDGSLYVADREGNEEIKAYIEQQKAEEDVKALIDRVSRECQTAVDSDPALKEYMDSLAIPDQESVIPDSKEVDVEVNKLVKAKETCNIRSDSREDADIIGSLNEGETITRLRVLDNGWTEVRMSDGSGYIRSDLITEDVQ